MGKLRMELSDFLKCRVYSVMLGLMAACGYGFAVTHYSIGMDDTAIPLYFEEGVAPYVGRWSMFVINRIFHMHISDFAPWMVELLSVLILTVSVTLWCVLWKRICEPKVTLPTWCYLFVAGIFLTCPLISEVFIFYLHNGVCTGYGLTALALLCLLESLSAGKGKRRQAWDILLSAIFLTIAVGFYESFMIVYVIGGIMAFFLIRRIHGRESKEAGYSPRVLLWIRNGFLSCAGSLLARTIILALLGRIYHLETLEKYDVLYRSLFGDNFRVEGELIMNLKRFWMMYYVHGVVYFPITVLVIALAGIVIYSLYYCIRKKDMMLFLCSLIIVILPVLMSIIEGIPTHYRSSQYVPLVGAFAVLLIMLELERRGRWLKGIGCTALAILIFNQCVDMNKWFYVDYLKYQDAAGVMKQVAQDIQAGFDSRKPVAIKGAYRVPYEIAKDAYCSFSSPEYRLICLLTDPIDPHLKEKYYAENGQGYIFAEAPIVSTLQWGITAFDGTCGQLIEFWKMHGYSFRCVTDPETIAEAERIMRDKNMPGYPQKGYIREEDDYIIVNLEHR